MSCDNSDLGPWQISVCDEAITLLLVADSMPLAQLRSLHTPSQSAVETRTGFDAALSVLKAQFGYDHFRAPQGEIMASLIEGRDRGCQSQLRPGC